MLIAPSTHHHIDRGLLLARIRVGLVVSWNNKIIHFCLQNLPPSRVFDIAPSGPCPILETLLVFVIVNIFRTKVSISVKFPTPGSILVSLNSCLLVVIGHLVGWYNAHRVQQKGEIFFQMS